MKIVHKILLIAVSLAGIVFSLCILSLFYTIPFITYTIGRYQDLYPWLNSVFAGFAAMICLCFFVLLLVTLFFPGKTSEVIFIKSRGALKFSKQTVESTARYSFADIGGVSYCKVRARISRKPEKTKIRVKLAFIEPGNLAEQTETIQTKIGEALKTSLGITAKSINVEVVGVSEDGEREMEQDADNGVRVI